MQGLLRTIVFVKFLWIQLIGFVFFLNTESISQTSEKLLRRNWLKTLRSDCFSSPLMTPLFKYDIC